MPIRINREPEIIVHIFCGILDDVAILLPINLPIDRKKSWKVATSNGKNTANTYTQ